VKKESKVWKAIKASRKSDDALATVLHEWYGLESLLP